MKKIYMQFVSKFLVFLTLFSFTTAFAQNVTIRGTVREASGQGLSGASVTIQGSSNGTLADNSGNYTIAVAPGRYTLVVSYVGFATQSIDVTAGPSGAVQDVILTGARDLGAVTVVGSRSAARTRTETPVPVDVIPLAQVINDVGQVDLNQIMTFIAPSFQSARQTIADGTDHLDPAQLRGLGTDQVLVLINGKRRHQSALVNVNGTVNRGQVNTDLSAIPATAIERIEILRDGASAQYGSDAIAGVINIVLKRRTGILESGASYGFHSSNFPKNYAINQLTGKNPNEKKGVDLLQKSINEIRTLCKQIITPVINDIGFKATIDELLTHFMSLNTFEIELTYNICEEGLEKPLQLTIYRIVQEQLNNIVKYARASCVRIAIKYEDEDLLISIKDNGIGFEVEKATKGLGLRNMKNRVEVYKGRIAINTSPGNGTELRVMFPVNL